MSQWQCPWFKFQSRVMIQLTVWQSLTDRLTVPSRELLNDNWKLMRCNLFLMWMLSNSKNHDYKIQVQIQPVQPTASDSMSAETQLPSTQGIDIIIHHVVVSNRTDIVHWPRPVTRSVLGHEHCSTGPLGQRIDSGCLVVAKTIRLRIAEILWCCGNAVPLQWKIQES